MLQYSTFPSFGPISGVAVNLGHAERVEEWQPLWLPFVFAQIDPPALIDLYLLG